MGNVQNKTKQQEVFSISRIFLEDRISKIETFFDPASISKKIHELKLEGRKLIVHVFPVFGATVNAVVYMEKNTSFHSPSARTLYETIIISKVFPDTKLPKKMIRCRLMTGRITFYALDVLYRVTRVTLVSAQSF